MNSFYYEIFYTITSSWQYHSFNEVKVSVNEPFLGVCI